MILNHLPIFPAAGRYVVRLHQDARPAEGRLIGRIEHVDSGDFADFATSQRLIDWLTQHAALLKDDAPTEDE